MLDKTIWLLRWVIAVTVGGALAIWLVADLFAMAGFRKTAEAIDDRFLDATPTAIILLAVLLMPVVAAWVICWLTQPSSTQS